MLLMDVDAKLTFSSPKSKRFSLTVSSGLVPILFWDASVYLAAAREPGWLSETSPAWMLAGVYRDVLAACLRKPTRFTATQ